MTAVERRSAVLMTRAVAMLDTADDAHLPLTSRERDTLRDVAVALKRVASTLQLLRKEAHEDTEEGNQDHAETCSR